MKMKGTSMLPLATTDMLLDSLKDYKINNHSTVELYFGIPFDVWQTGPHPLPGPINTSLDVGSQQPQVTQQLCPCLPDICTQKCCVFHNVLGVASKWEQCKCLRHTRGSILDMSTTCQWHVRIADSTHSELDSTPIRHCSAQHRFRPVQPLQT